MAIPKKVEYLIIGAGIHGLSTAWHLAEKLKVKGKKIDASKILVVDKNGIASGASGVACGVVRNNYFQPAMRELMAHSVEVWESDPQTFHYHPVGYMQISPKVMEEDVASIHEQQQAIGYESTFVQGEKESFDYMKNFFDDWQAKGVTSVLHEKKGGYANNTSAIYGLAQKAEDAGVRILTGATVKGFKTANGSKAITAVETDLGSIQCDQVVVGVGPWLRDIWDMLELPKTISIKDDNGKMHEEFPMWEYWFLTEGVLRLNPSTQRTNDGNMPPVLHVDTDAPLYSDVDQSLITDKIWGIYYKPDFHFQGIQGGSSPYKVKIPAADVNVDPYGPDSEEFVVGDDFAHMWTSALAFCQKRFEGKSHLYKQGPTGGLGCFTPDNFPIFDRFCENVHIIADSNHGYKMIGVGKLVANEILDEKSELLEPFRFSRFKLGKLHPRSNSPFPWS
ncbi:MAG: FAD-binding oxidoreductase [Pelagibacteraceae bacterium]|jgi:glycine/D-amino acid oxidase-like deaminating enzyme|nr:FAD-binding oxidoreductase [Pelagibacteraceae bacterium]MBO6469682.1 FAD-binding oxidoreductase [Pelagibacteraceae bacterium]MBO6479435.1 FAD-binding oxidoreductase [Pelagibacteraceae bacterium]MBU77910.1 monomeric sarcosine oxidase [Candidatus Neomarinimicrobiota bacterium]HJO13433.1 FAD-binding oxidoreductase [Alphaproteobacteria bacterium]